jgi:antitoxin component of MazEF toxin-antitoxin module
MIVSTKKTDRRARIVLPEDFANETVVIERVGPNELRLRKKKTLAQLVAGITPENLHGEWDTGPAVGREVL